VRFVKDKKDRLPDLATELVRLKVDCFITTGTGGARAAQRATSTIPIVMAHISDPVGRGFVASLARPGGNITGLATLGSELAGKRLELLKEAFPKVSQLAVVLDPTAAGSASRIRQIEVAARVLGLQHQFLLVRDPADFENAFRAAGRERLKAFMIVTTPLMHRNRARIIKLAVKSQLPAMYTAQRFVRAGGLMYYGPDRNDLYRRSATYVDKILKGAKPADLPVEQPKKFDLVINLKTAKQMGITIPPTVIYQATKVIK
jgi:putative ABC transport system substrate-binding protein